MNFFPSSLFPDIGNCISKYNPFANPAAILKDSDFSEVDRAECQFMTTATVLENGSQVWPQSNTISPYKSHGTIWSWNLKWIVIE